MEKTMALQKIHCTHCDELTANPIFNVEDSERGTPFCCNGCKAVYNLLNEKGLEEYYEIKDNSDSKKRSSPVKEVDDKFTYLDDPEFQKDFCKNENGQVSASFYLEGVHCLACLWLVEKTPEFIDGVNKARLDLGKSVADFVVSDKVKLSQVASEISRFGYTPHPLKKGEEVEKLKQKEERTNLLKIGIAGACAGNTMLYSVGLYAGADGLFAKSFEYIAFIFTIPVMFYSASPFYKGTIHSLKRKLLSIDVPIAFALWVAFVASVYHLIIGSGKVYFDLINTLVFLMLLSRYFMKKASESGLSSDGLSHFFQSTNVLRKKESGEFETIHAKYIKKGDILKIMPGETFCVDGEIIEGSSYINTSVLTGESHPVKANISHKVYSGSVNQEHPLLIKVEKMGNETRMGEILNNVEKSRNERAPIVTKVDLLTKYFVGIVLVLAIAVLVYFAIAGELTTGFNRALALIIISCPCALGLATPLAMTRSLSKATKLGVIVKNEAILESMSHLNNLVIDKTGTLTHGQFEVIDAKELSQKRASIVHSLEKKSHHPIAQALCRYLEGQYNLVEIAFDDFKEQLGKGVVGQVNGFKYEVCTIKDEDRNSNQKVFTQIGLYENDELIGHFILRDTLREDAKASLTALQKMGLRTIMASGDNQDVVAYVAQELSLSHDNALSNMTPEKKAELINSLDSTIMIGDGANDALAISRADLGIAVKGSVTVSLRAAEAYLTISGLKPVVNLVELSKETIKLVHRNLFFSLLYNLIGAYAAVFGYVTPLWAAIFMPASSVTVLISTLIATRKMRKMGGEN
ncbi:copper-exporting ATPase [Bacteriovorax sp. BSW11_IV]|uniref:heavy metal translocating P-type ATPase n=1 Tax=Bacteriovorax sp. BSW11_IV TaxID=1353529 RepID=UPI00038A2306|nr:heavy metal translocating P-type ATPase [Bacteriovorax sp. BSW11_IV]EQC43055.1 copper-exporting ATPase [Bacteriovorax sp. BSW11_IV]